jgi:TMEM175 potassium channel family protein
VSRERQIKRREGNEIEFSRIVAFSDGVFAVAITLLALNLAIDTDIPKDEIGQAILDQRENFLAYGISFAVIGRFWLVHHGFFGEVNGFDGRLISLNMLYLAFIVLIPFSSQVLGDFGGETPAVITYALNLAAVVLIGLWMTADARRAGLTTVDAETHRENRIRAGYISAVFLASIPVAFVAPNYAPLMWLVLFFDPAERIVRGDSGSR